MTGLSDCKFFSSRLLRQNRFFTKSGSVLEVSITKNIENTLQQYAEEIGKLLALLPITNYKIVTHNYPSCFHISIQYSATMTNISHDYIGQSGIESLSDLAALKGIIYAELKASGVDIH